MDIMAEAERERAESADFLRRHLRPARAAVLDGPPARSGAGRVVRLLLAVVTALLLAVGGQVARATPAYAHAELVDSTPGNGARLDEPPTEVVLRFTEEVSVVQGAFRLLDGSSGDEVPTPGSDEGLPDASTVRFGLPEDLPDGSYLVSWRVVSADSHPIGGTFSFGVGQEAAAVPDDSAAPAAPWPVTVARGAGYVAFALVAGALALVLLCWRQGRTDGRLRRLRSVGVVAGVAASVSSLLLEGPYVAGTSMWRLFDPEVMAHVAHGQYGTWIHLRVLLYLLIGGVLWLPDALEEASNRWLAGLAVVGLAATFPGTGHAAAAGNLLEPAADAVHALSAAVWVGGLLGLLVLSQAAGPRPGRDAFLRFSRLALASVVVLVATGSLATLAQLNGWSDLWDTGYGRLLSVKLALVAAVLAAAAVSRRTLAAGGAPRRAVRFEAVGTVVVLAVTSSLAVTAPPSRGAAEASGVASSRRTTVALDLGVGEDAQLVVDGLTTGSSRLHLTVPGEQRGPRAVRSVSLRAELPAEGLGASEIPLTRTADGWRGEASFPVAGTWTLTLTVERRNLDAVVTAGTLTVG